MARTTNLNLPEIEQNEVNGDATHNEGLWITDLHGQPIVEALQTAEPGSPAEGQAWIINGTPSGPNWGTGAAANQVAHFYGGIWHYNTPAQGWRFYAKSDTLVWQFNGISWQIYIAGDIPPNNTIRIDQGYVTPWTTPSITADTWQDIIIATNGQIGSDFSYNDTTGELTYTGVNAVAGLGFIINVGGAGISNNQNYSVRIINNAEIVILGGVYVTSNQTDAISVSGTMLDVVNTNDILKIQVKPSNTTALDITGGWYANVVYLV